MKLRITRWAVYVTHMAITNTAYKILIGKPKVEALLIRP
jgi:hypothetical protein